MRFFILIVAAMLCFASNTYSQYQFKCTVKEEEDKDALAGVTATIVGTNKSAASDANGNINFSDLPAGNISITFTNVGFLDKTITFTIPQTATVVIFLEKKEKTEEEVIVTSSRTNTRIEDLSTRVEVIGSEEMDEEAGTLPGNVVGLLGDIAGIQSQRTSESTNSVDLRVQGLPGKYTQILRDGFPVSGDYGGNFSVLQIPPLDLKQIEIIKGASSTLYGGGAIAGMIHIISKTPNEAKPEHSLLINHSSLKETNVNTFHSFRNKKFGYTLFAGSTFQTAVDVNNDGFSDVPDIKAFFLHPKLFLFPDQKNTLTLEYNG
ncbi:MAG TPA: TonB-dependent receptor plug domain-containing protein, partial [Ferruginibacter sp.]|nr:TonB-dependent receptor plug domain-containing protein [Ferruginibacter sp.]